MWTARELHQAIAMTVRRSILMSEVSHTPTAVQHTVMTRVDDISLTSQPTSAWGRVWSTGYTTAVPPECNYSYATFGLRMCYCG